MIEARVAYLAGGVLAYLVGAVPFGFLIARAAGVDIRTVGSGNIGATNVLRALGKGPGYATFACDFLKGLVAAGAIPWVVSRLGPAVPTCPLAVVCGVMAVVGHNWPVYLGFRGGKGVATSAGVLLAVAPVAVGIGLAVWGVFFLLFRYVSLASLAASVAIVGAGWGWYGRHGLLLPSALTALGLLSVWRHRSNIRRLLDGTEHRFRSSGAGGARDPDAKGNGQG